MTRNFGVLAAVVLTLGFLGHACTSGEVVDGPLTGSAGSANPGTAGAGVAGTTGAGNTVGTAGNTANRGGNVGTAGNTANRGGTTGTAGRGGTTGTGNTVGTAGTTGTGNTVGTAGTTGSGNTAGTAGVSGTAGSVGTTCGTTFEASADGFVRAPAAGGACFHGYAFAGGDAGSTITPATFSACGTPCMLKMTGTVGPAVAPSYAGVAYMGFNVAQDSGSSTKGTLVPTGSSLTVAFSATTGSQPLRAQLSSGSSFWCYTITGASPVTIPYASFNTDVLGHGGHGRRRVREDGDRQLRAGRAGRRGRDDGRQRDADQRQRKPVTAADPGRRLAVFG